MNHDTSNTSNASAQPRDSFARAFLPGLILGLVIGAAAGAFLPDLLTSRPKLPEAPVGPRTHAMPRDERPEEQATPTDGTPTVAPSPQAKEAPVDPAGGKAQPPASKEPAPVAPAPANPR